MTSHLVRHVTSHLRYTWSSYHQLMKYAQWVSSNFSSRIWCRAISNQERYFHYLPWRSFCISDPFHFRSELSSRLTKFLLKIQENLKWFYKERNHIIHSLLQSIRLKNRFFIDPSHESRNALTKFLDRSDVCFIYNIVEGGEVRREIIPEAISENFLQKPLKIPHFKIRKEVQHLWLPGWRRLPEGRWRKFIWC